MSQSESYELIIINNVICLLNLRREFKNRGVVWNLLNWTIAANPQSIRKLSVTIPTPPHTRVLCQTCQTGFVWWWSPRPMSLRVAHLWSRHNGVWSSIVLQQCYICSGKKLFFLFLLYPEKSVTFHINHITEVTLVSLLSVISSMDCPMTSGMQPCQGIQSPADIFCDIHLKMILIMKIGNI